MVRAALAESSWRASGGCRCGGFGGEKLEADFVDAPAAAAAHGFDAHRQVGEFYLIAGAGQPFEMGGEQSGDGRGVRDFHVGAEGVHPVGHRKIAGHEVFIGADTFNEVGGDVVRFINITDHLLDDIGERDHADESAEFINGDGELGAGLAEVEEKTVEQLAGRERSGEVAGFFARRDV